MAVKKTEDPAAAIARYSIDAGATLGPVCDRLRAEIETAMPPGSGRIYYTFPTWFIEGNPVVGYKSLEDRLYVVFWSGRSFTTPGLTPGGKFKAAYVEYRTLGDIDSEVFRKWLAEAKNVIWNYRDMRKKAGRLELLS